MFQSPEMLEMKRVVLRAAHGLTRREALEGISTPTNDDGARGLRFARRRAVMPALEGALMSETYINPALVVGLQAEAAVDGTGMLLKFLDETGKEHLLGLRDNSVPDLLIAMAETAREMAVNRASAGLPPKELVASPRRAGQVAHFNVFLHWFPVEEEFQVKIGGVGIQVAMSPEVVRSFAEGLLRELGDLPPRQTPPSALN